MVVLVMVMEEMKKKRREGSEMREGHREEHREDERKTQRTLDVSGFFVKNWDFLGVAPSGSAG